MALILSACSGETTQQSAERTDEVLYNEAESESYAIPVWDKNAWSRHVSSIAPWSSENFMTVSFNLLYLENENERPQLIEYPCVLLEAYIAGEMKHLGMYNVNNPKGLAEKSLTLNTRAMEDREHIGLLPGTKYMLTVFESDAPTSCAIERLEPLGTQALKVVDSKEGIMILAGNGGLITSRVSTTTNIDGTPYCRQEDIRITTLLGGQVPVSLISGIECILLDGEVSQTNPKGGF